MKIFLLVLSFLFVDVSFSQNKCKTANRKIKKIEKKILHGYTDELTVDLEKLELLCNDPVFINLLGDVYFSLKKK